MPYKRKIIRDSDVHEITGLSKSTRYRLEKNGNFPQCVRLGANSVGWYENEVLDWVESRPRGFSDAPAPALEQNPKHLKHRMRQQDVGNLPPAA